MGGGSVMGAEGDSGAPGGPGAFSRGAATYLDTPTMGLPPRTAVTEMTAALRTWFDAVGGFERWEGALEACRTMTAGDLGVSTGDLALVPSVVPVVGYLGAELARRPGVLLAHRAEYRSLLLPLLAAFGEDRVRWVEGEYTSASFLDRLDSGVAVAAICSVSSHDGARVDLTRVLDGCTRVGAELVVDASQSAGIVSLGVPADAPAAVVCAGYKGLLGPRGAAYGVVRPDLATAAPAAPSLYGMGDGGLAGSYGPPLAPRAGARRLDQSPAWFSWLGARAGLDALTAWSACEREEHALALAGRLRSALEASGVDVQRSDLPSPVVSVGVQGADGAAAGALASRLGERGVRAAVRRGRLRMGSHLYVAGHAVDRALEVLLSSRVVSRLP